MKRGEVYNVNFEPIQGSEQGGTRPAIIVSNDAINKFSSVVIVVPCTTYRHKRKLYRSQILIKAPDGGMDNDSVALGEQVRAVAKSRLSSRRGVLSDAALAQLDQALLTALSLPNS